MDNIVWFPTHKHTHTHTHAYHSAKKKIVVCCKYRNGLTKWHLKNASIVKDIRNDQTEYIYKKICYYQNVCLHGHINLVLDQAPIRCMPICFNKQLYYSKAIFYAWLSATILSQLIIENQLVDTYSPYVYIC